MLCRRTSAWAGCGWPCAAEQREVLCVQGLCSPGTEPPLLPALPFPEPLCEDSHPPGMLPALLLVLDLLPVGCRALLGLWGKALVLQDPRASQGCRTPAGGHALQHPSGLTLHHNARAAVPQGAAGGVQLTPAMRKIILSSPSCCDPCSRPCCAKGGRWRRAAARPRRSRRAGERLGGDGPRLPQPLPLDPRGLQGLRRRAGAACAPCRDAHGVRAGRRARCAPGPAPAGEGAAGTWRAPNPGRRAVRCLRGNGLVSWPAKRSFKFKFKRPKSAPLLSELLHPPHAAASRLREKPGSFSLLVVLGNNARTAEGASRSCFRVDFFFLIFFPCQQNV